MSLAGASPEYFRTADLFAPFGTSLVLNTSSPLQAWVGATVLGGLPLARALNVVLLGGLAANGFTAYLLAHAFTRRFWPSVMAGTSFATCAYVSVHPLGHFNLVHAWVLPLAFLAWVLLLDAPTAPRALAAAAAFAATAYSDYYYFVYAVFAAVLWWGIVATNATLAWRSGRFRRTSRAVLVLAGLALAAGIIIRMSSGVEVRSRAAPRQRGRGAQPGLGCGALPAGVGAAAPRRGRPASRLLHSRDSSGPPAQRGPRPAAVAREPKGSGGGTEAGVSGDGRDAAPQAWRRQLACIVLATAAGAALVLPLAAAAVSLVRSGDYVSQQYFWRSAPRGDRSRHRPARQPDARDLGRLDAGRCTSDSAST